MHNELFCTIYTVNIMNALSIHEISDYFESNKYIENGLSLIVCLTNNKKVTHADPLRVPHGR